MPQCSLCVYVCIQRVLLLCVGEEETQNEVDSLAKAAEDIGYDDISDDELDDLIEGADDEQDEKPAESTGDLTCILLIIIIIIKEFHRDASLTKTLGPLYLVHIRLAVYSM